MDTARRVSELRKVIEAEALDGMLVSSVPNVTYLSAFTGDDSLALVTPDRLAIITDFRYVEQVEQECPGWEVVRREKDLWQTTAAAVTESGVRRLGFETAHLSHAGFRKLTDVLGDVEVVPLEGKVETLRQIKDAREVRAIEAALRCQEAAFAEVKACVRPGMTERQVACELDYRMRRHGAEQSAFETIVACGERGSLPHARATERVISQGDAVLVDWGARCFFYNSDLTRLLHVGTVSGEFEKVYHIVRQAQNEALAVIRPGVKLCEVDGAARAVIRDRGYGERFGHSLGHGVGLEVHESPVVRERNEEPVQPGMVFTIEPGIYIPGWGGVRIEDMVLVTDDGVRVLSDCEKDLDGIVV
ncbi:MAG TPA: Xaa-Pro peptidase family protein [Planctomycetota bacterium]|nr:Xaa-Pro peptidase family protein [Planctomycetota bacterium]